MLRIAVLLMLLTCTTVSGQTKGILLENLTWYEAEQALKPETVVVLPIGAAAKEHGPHLKLKTDWTVAEYIKKRVLDKSEVVIAPTIAYNYYPAFTEYPGSTTLRLETARDLIIDICRSLARYGPKKFYALNMGISTLHALEPAAKILGAEGITLRYTDLEEILGPVEKTVSRQEGGTHADEGETSMMLYIDPSSVNMSKAVKDYHPDGGPLTRNPKGKGTYSPTGAWGDPTLASRAEGEKLVEVLVSGVLKEIEALQRQALR
jgi:creatinine amidohydrolase